MQTKGEVEMRSRAWAIFLCLFALFGSTARAQVLDIKTAIGSGPVLVGTIVAFAGKVDAAMETALADAGWLPCDGRPLPLKNVGGAASAYIALHRVI
jgi:hypothetical protein